MQWDSFPNLCTHMILVYMWDDFDGKILQKMLAYSYSGSCKHMLFYTPSTLSTPPPPHSIGGDDD